MIEKNEQLCHFNNKKEELEYYKSKYESFFKELIKYQLKVKSLENSNNKLREKVSNFLNKNSTNNNNSTETNFLTPSEFKKLWEYIIKTELIETFDFCINEYILIANLCQDIMLLVYEECRKNINEKFIEVLNCLNLGKISKDKREKMFNHFLPFFRENFNKIFIFSDNFLNIINTKLLSIIVEYNYNNDIINQNNNNNNSLNKDNNSDNDNNNNHYLNKIKEKIKENNFDDVIKSFYKICIYMLLHEPILNFDLQKYSERKLNYFYYNNNDFINVDGFINENSPCIMLLSAPLLKNKFNFHNLRAPVYIIHNPNEYILNECEKNKDKFCEKKEDDIIYSDRIKLNNKQDEFPRNYKRNKTFEEKQSNIQINPRNSPIKKQISNLKNNNTNKDQNIVETDEVYNNINISNDINYNLQKYIKITKSNENVANNKSIKANDDLQFNSLDNKLLYIVSQQNTMENNNNKNPSDIVQKYINTYEKRKNSNLISSSTGNFDAEIKEKNYYDKDNSNYNINNKINNIEQNINEIIMGNLNKIKESKLKEYYINNKNKNKKGIRNKNSKYCIKNHIYTNIKNMPNTTNNRIVSKKNNFIHNNSQYFDLFSDKKISPSPSNLLKSYESFNDSSETNNIQSPKKEKFKNYNSFTHLLHFSSVNPILPINAPITPSHNMIYNNLVLKGIKNNFNINNFKKKYRIVQII